MFDGRWRGAVDRSTRPVGQTLHRYGVTADMLTATGLVSATATAVVVGMGHLHVAIVLLILTGLHDLLTGRWPRRRAPHRCGGPSSTR